MKDTVSLLETRLGTEEVVGNLAKLLWALWGFVLCHVWSMWVGVEKVVSKVLAGCP